MRVLRVSHAGRDPAQRVSDRAIAASGVDLTLVVPSTWPEAGSETRLTHEGFSITEMGVQRPGDVNRHYYVDDAALRRLLNKIRPDVLDLHEEPVSLVARQWLRAAPPELPVVLYTAQNIDKRFPPPFAQYERRAFLRADALYPCSRQAASVARGKGFAGEIEVLPLGYDDSLIGPGDQSLHDDVLVMGLIGRMVPEKGVLDAVYCLSQVVSVRPARLVLVGNGPEIEPALAVAKQLGIDQHVEVCPWLDAKGLSALYRSMHIVLVPSTATPRWVEQFGRVIVEAQASGAVVATYASGAIPEVVAGAGLLAAEGDVNGLSRRIRSVVKDLEKWTSLRTAGLSLAQSRTWEAVAARRQALYGRAVRTNDAQPVGRDEARVEFGPPAVVLGERRPFALPILREPTAVSRGLAAALDLAAKHSQAG